jgi:hypothetical protein
MEQEQEMVKEKLKGRERGKRKLREEAPGG